MYYFGQMMIKYKTRDGLYVFTPHKLNIIYSMPYDTHGGGHRGESRLYCPGMEVKFSEMTSGAEQHKSSRKILLPSEDNIRAQC